MLEIVKYGKGEYPYPALLALGCFDGIHKGHTELLKNAKLQAKINGLDFGVMLFVGGKGGKQLFTFEERLKILENFNVKFVYAIDFTEQFKKITPAEFLAETEKRINVKAYMSGKDFRFGAGAKGKSSTLKAYAEDEDNGVWYMPVKDVTYNGEKISSTLVKEKLEQGDIAAVNGLLGRNYYVTATVSHGAGRGASELGFPTVNVDYPEDKVCLKQGVFAVKCTLGEKEYLGIANYGPRPTFGEEQPLLEVHIKDFSGDCYGEQIKVEFLEYIRDIKKFAGADGLAAQLKEDIKTLDRIEREIAAKQLEEKKQEESKRAVKPVPAAKRAAAKKTAGLGNIVKIVAAADRVVTTESVTGRLRVKAPKVIKITGASVYANINKNKSETITFDGATK